MMHQAWWPSISRLLQPLQVFFPWRQATVQLYSDRDWRTSGRGIVIFPADPAWGMDSAIGYGRCDHSYVTANPNTICHLSGE